MCSIKVKMPRQSKKKDKSKKRKLVDTSAKKDDLDIFMDELEKKTIRQMKDWVLLYNGDVHAQAEAYLNGNDDGDNDMTEKEVWKDACKAVYGIEIKQLEMMDSMVKRRKINGNNNGNNKVNEDKNADEVVVDLTDKDPGDNDEKKNDDGDGNGEKKKVRFNDSQLGGEEKKEQVMDNMQMFQMMQQTLKSMTDGMVQAVSKVVDGNNGGNDNNNPSVCFIMLYGYIVFCVFFILVQFYFSILYIFFYWCVIF